MVEKRIIGTEEYILSKKELYTVYKIIEEFMHNYSYVGDEVNNLYNSIYDLEIFNTVKL